jgi:tripartite-type tricarboxylate transporter receptor subunit TctC
VNKVVFASRFARSLAKIAPMIVVAALGGRAIAADYPNRPVSLIVPFVAGSAIDVFARIWPKA